MNRSYRRWKAECDTRDRQPAPPAQPIAAALLSGTSVQWGQQALMQSEHFKTIEYQRGLQAARPSAGVLGAALAGGQRAQSSSALGVPPLRAYWDSQQKRREDLSMQLIEQMLRGAR